MRKSQQDHWTFPMCVAVVIAETNESASSARTAFVMASAYRRAFHHAKALVQANLTKQGDSLHSPE